jgi:hypothetical protein
MKKTILLVSSNREINIDTQRCISAIKRAGAPLVLERGSSDPAQARNSGLSAVCEQFRLYPEYDTLLMLDDDIICPLEVAEHLVNESRSCGFACSAVYVTTAKRVAGGRWPPPEGREWPDGLRRRWVFGLGCLAIPKTLLLDVEKNSESYSVGERVLSEFCWSKAEAGQWIAEDYRLCMRLGGVKLLPVAVGHVKMWPLYADQETLDAIHEDRMIQPIEVVPQEAKHG